MNFCEILLMLIYDAVLCFFDCVIHTFFREVRSRGSANIPPKGPVLFVCAPHSNLFVDPVVLMDISRKESGRQISLLVAAKSYRTWHVGTAARLCSAIPVERAQDLVKPYNGTIRIENFGPHNDNLTVIGEGTNFTRDASVKGLIGLQQYLGNAKIKSIESPTKLTLQKPFVVNFESPTQKDKRVIEGLRDGFPYVLAPYIDNGKAFHSVFKHLSKGQAVGIFSEGGSHDRTTLLPLKPGVALMALGAAAQSEDPNFEVKIVPVGLNYFNPNKFRSSVVIEYGKPISITKKESARYEQNKKEVVDELLKNINLRLLEVTVTCDNIETLTAIQTARRLYAPTDRESTSLPMKVEMTRRLIKGYQMHSYNPELRELMDSLTEYNKKVRQLGLRDHQVMALEELNRWSVLFTFMSRATKCLLYSCLSIPGTVMFGPIFVLGNYISSKKAKAAVASSVVKIKGKDVIATWKIMVALGAAPMLYMFWAFLGVKLLLGYERCTHIPVWVLSLSCYLLNVFITYCSLRTGEIGYEYFISLRPLAYSLLSKHHDTRQIKDLKHNRQILAEKVTNYCKTYGPSLFDDYSKFYDTYSHVNGRNESERGGETYQSMFSLKKLSDVSILSHIGESLYITPEDSTEDVPELEGINKKVLPDVTSDCTPNILSQVRMRRPNEEKHIL